jgi:dihydrofolate reductase
MATRLTAVVAATENDVIGRDNGMPWHLPADLAHFKAVTLGHPVLMGRKTFEAIGRPLPGRRNFVLSRGGAFKAPGVESVASLDEALAAAGDVPELMIIGGAAVYELALSRTDRVHLTRLHMAMDDGDAFFPMLPESDWHEVSRSERRPADEHNACDMTFLVLERRSA